MVELNLGGVRLSSLGEIYRCMRSLSNSGTFGLTHLCSSRVYASAEETMQGRNSCKKPKHGKLRIVVPVACWVAFSTSAWGGLLLDMFWACGTWALQAVQGSRLGWLIGSRSCSLARTTRKTGCNEAKRKQAVSRQPADYWFDAELVAVNTCSPAGAALQDTTGFKTCHSR